MSEATIVINGWSVYAHPLFLDQLHGLISQVEKTKTKDPSDFKRKRATKLLAALLKIAFEDIPSDPTRDVYRQGRTLGDDYKHWFSAKFLQQYRLFFRYQQSGASQIIILAWVNDQSTLRAYDSATDAYAVFRTMLRSGNPPDDWENLPASAQADDLTGRLTLLPGLAAGNRSPQRRMQELDFA